MCLEFKLLKLQSTNKALIRMIYISDIIKVKWTLEGYTKSLLSHAHIYRKTHTNAHTHSFIFSAGTSRKNYNRMYYKTSKIEWRSITIVKRVDINGLNTAIFSCSTKYYEHVLQYFLVIMKWLSIVISIVIKKFVNATCILTYVLVSQNSVLPVMKWLNNKIKFIYG